MKGKLCYVGKTAPLYREGIFTMMDSTFDIDWYFGETKSDIKEMDISKLKHTNYYWVLGDSSKVSWKVGVISLLFKNKYQSIMMHVETRAISDWLFVLLKSLFFPKKNLYTWAHGWYGKESRFEAAVKLWMYRRLTKIFVYGQYAKDLIVQHGISEEKVIVIHNSLNYDKQKEIRDTLQPSDIYRNHFGNERPTLIFIGRLTKVKKLDQVLQALLQLNAKGEIYNLVLVGGGEEKASLEKLSVEMGLGSQVWFHGPSYDERTNAELLFNADLCVSPGNVGLTAMHAMVYGCPVVTHDSFQWQMPEFEAVHEGVTGTFFEMDNVDSLGESISIWINNSYGKREQIRQSCFTEIDSKWNPYVQIQILKTNI